MSAAHHLSKGRRRALLPVAAFAALVLSYAVHVPPAAADPPRASCQEFDVPVSLDILLSAHVHVQLCVPGGERHRVVQMLLPGATYNSYYWDFPYQPDTYSYVRAANAAGYPTLNVDRVGTGGSSREPSVAVTLASQAAVVHQLVRKLRAGAIGGIAFTRVVLVGHSLGSALAEAEASTYHDVAGVVLTGATHHVSAVDLTGAVLTAAYPAVEDPKFGAGYDLGYLTTVPGKRASVFYSAADTDPGVVAADEAGKDVVSATELAGAVLELTGPASRDVTAPVLIAQGGADSLFCSGPLSSDCRSAEALYRQEAPYFCAAARLRTYVLAGAGHDVNLERNAADYRRAVTDWLGQFVPGA
jgi:pimeloyl-ACP methyl ester carboxylesterase